MTTNTNNIEVSWVKFDNKDAVKGCVNGKEEILIYDGEIKSSMSLPSELNSAKAVSQCHLKAIEVYTNKFKVFPEESNKIEDYDKDIYQISDKTDSYIVGKEGFLETLQRINNKKEN